MAEEGLSEKVTFEQKTVVGIWKRNETFQGAVCKGLGDSQYRWSRESGGRTVDQVREVAEEQGTEGFVGYYKDFGFYA